MSLVSGYPAHQAYTGGGLTHELYSYPHQAGAGGTGPSRGYQDHHTGLQDPSSTPSPASYFSNWMFNSGAGGVSPHSLHHQHPHHHPDLGLTGPGGDPYGRPGATHPHHGGLAPPGSEFNMLGFMDMGGTGMMRLRTATRKKGGNNRKERRRTLSINSAFANLRGCIPNVPSDTKLSKIKTLRLATSYIAYLMDMLNKEETASLSDGGGFKAEINKKIESREEKRKRESEEILRATSGEKKGKGRTGWPQHVWASELNATNPNPSGVPGSQASQDGCKMLNGSPDPCSSPDSPGGSSDQLN